MQQQTKTRQQCKKKTKTNKTKQQSAGGSWRYDNKSHIVMVSTSGFWPKTGVSPIAALASFFMWLLLVTNHTSQEFEPVAQLSHMWGTLSKGLNVFKQLPDRLTAYSHKHLHTACTKITSTTTNTHKALTVPRKRRQRELQQHRHLQQHDNQQQQQQQPRFSAGPLKKN